MLFRSLASLLESACRARALQPHIAYSTTRPVSRPNGAECVSAFATGPKASRAEAPGSILIPTFIKSRNQVQAPGEENRVCFIACFAIAC